MATEAFTYMSPQAVFEVIARMQDNGEPYELTLNAADFQELITALYAVWNDVKIGDDLMDWVGSFVSDIASTLGIEMI